MEATTPLPTTDTDSISKALTSEGSEKVLDASFMKISPEMASEFLAKNRRNRPVREERVDRYSTLMKDREWLPSPDAIAFDYNGRLINGQHRLKAIQQSGETVTALVVWNLPPDAFKISDVGIKRTPADALTVEGFKFPHELAATTKLVVLWLRHDLDQCNRYENVENMTIVDVAEQCTPRIQKSIRLVNNHKTGLRKLPFPRSLLAFGHFIYKPTYGHDADRFVERFAEGVKIQDWEEKYNVEGAVSPVKLLRDKMAESGSNLNRESKLAYLVQAMNWFCKEEPHKRLRYRASDSFPEPEVDMIPEFRDQLEIPGLNT